MKLILVVDDEQYYREIFSVKLNVAGYKVETADGGAQAVEKTRALNPDLVLMDVRMPEVDGIEALDRIMKDPELNKTKVLFLTNLGRGHENTRQLDDNFAKQIGAIGFMEKSEDLNQLVERVKALLS